MESEHRPKELSPVLRDEQSFGALLSWLETTSALPKKLERVREEVRASLGPGQRATLAAALERLRMLQIVEQGLAVGDTLPDFALPDPAGRIIRSDELLSQGPLALIFIRGLWCPYCSLTLQALDETAPAMARAGGHLVVIAPARGEELARAGRERRLGLTLLRDAKGLYAQLCGLRYAMSDAQAELYRGFGLDPDRLNAEGDWMLPVPATYVAGRDGVISYTFADADWSRRADPAEIVAAVERLGQAAEAVG